MFARKIGSGWMSRSRFLVCLLVLAAAGCAVTPDVRTDSAPGVDFKQFRTFSFLPSLSTDRAGYHTLVSQQLTFSTRRELEVRGLEFVADPAKADVLVNFHTDVSEQLRVRTVPDPWVGSSYWNHRRGRYGPWRGHSTWPGPSSRIEVDQMSLGRLSVDVIDRKQNMLVWEGVASQRLTQRTMSGLGPEMDNAVHLIFRQFPVLPTL